MVDAMSAVVMPLMLFAFFGGLLARALIYYTARSEARFALEFEKRVRVYLMATDAPRVASFYRITRILLEKTFIECFEMRDKFKRRNLDAVWSLTDRLFLIQDGSRRLIEDTLRSIRYFRREGMPPKMVETAKSSFESNPYFNRVLGIVPVAFLHELLNILPGMFLIGGILGTFLGISKGLPELGGMDLGNVDETKRVMDAFLMTISHAMLKSIVGIAFSAAMTLINTMFSVEGLYYSLVNRYSNALDYLWNETTTNEVDAVERTPAAPPKKAA
ncbi:MAG: hypothetical protein A2X94_00975 [Bdellovibrionales bacterium GWB1_55_8]|nr:MAG: hypothetical protein A2X94_00975 [Bdellovibrionales bacterium GWB1_55_8]